MLVPNKRVFRIPVNYVIQITSLVSKRNHHLDYQLVLYLIVQFDDMQPAVKASPALCISIAGGSVIARAGSIVEGFIESLFAFSGVRPEWKEDWV